MKKITFYTAIITGILGVVLLIAISYILTDKAGAELPWYLTFLSVTVLMAFWVSLFWNIRLWSRSHRLQKH